MQALRSGIERRALLACLYMQASDLLVLPQLVEHVVEIR